MVLFISPDRGFDVVADAILLSETIQTTSEQILHSFCKGLKYAYLCRVGGSCLAHENFPFTTVTAQSGSGVIVLVTREGSGQTAVS